MIFLCSTHKGVGLIEERHVCLFEAKIYSPGEDLCGTNKGVGLIERYMCVYSRQRYICQVRTCAVPTRGCGSLKDMRVYSKRRYIRQVRTRTPGEDTYARLGHVTPGEDTYS